MADEKEEQGAVSATATAEEGSVVDQALEKARQTKQDVIPHTVVSEKSLPKSSREVVVEIPRAEWDQRLAKLFKDIQQNAAVEGFRKGKVPVKLLQRRFLREASNELVERITPPIIGGYEQEKKLTLYGVPTVTEFNTDGSGPVRITIVVETKPEIEPQNYTGIELEVPAYKYEEQLVDRRIEELRTQSATYEEADKTFGGGDAVVVDLKAVDAKGHTVSQETEKLYSDPHAELPHAVYHALEGKKAGDTVEDVKATPAGGGAEARYTVTIRAVKALKLPEVDDEFAKDLGQENLEALRTTIRGQAEKSIQSANEDEAFEKLVDKLVETHDFEVPPALKAHVERDMARSDYSFLTRTGMTPPRLRGLASRQAYKDQLDKAAEQRVKGFLLLDAIGQKENIKVEDEDINAALEERAQQEGRKAVAIRAALEKRKEYGQFVEQVRFDKIRKHLIERTKISYVDRPEPEADGEGTNEVESLGEPENK